PEREPADQRHSGTLLRLAELSERDQYMAGAPRRIPPAPAFVHRVVLVFSHPVPEPPGGVRHTTLSIVQHPAARAGGVLLRLRIGDPAGDRPPDRGDRDSGRNHRLTRRVRGDAPEAAGRAGQALRAAGPDRAGGLRGSLPGPRSLA